MHHPIGIHERWQVADLLVRIAILRVAEEPQRREHEPCLGAEQLRAIVVRLRLVSGPRGFEQDRAAALQLDQGDAEIIDIERLAWIDFAAAPGAVAEPPRAELGVGLAADGGGVELAHQVETAVEGMDADVVGDAPAGELPLREPRTDPWDPAAPRPGRLGVIDIAEHILGDELLGGLSLGDEAAILADHEEQALLARLVHDLGGIGGIRRDGLVEHHVLSCLEGRERDRGVQVVWQGDRDHVDVRTLEQVAVIRDQRRHAELLRRLLAALGIDLRDGDHAGGRVLLERLDVVRTDATGTDDGDVEEVLGHGVGGVSEVTRVRGGGAGLRKA